MKKIVVALFEKSDQFLGQKTQIGHLKWLLMPILVIVMDFHDQKMKNWWSLFLTVSDRTGRSFQKERPVFRVKNPCLPTKIAC